MNIPLFLQGIHHQMKDLFELRTMNIPLSAGNSSSNKKLYLFLNLHAHKKFLYIIKLSLGQIMKNNTKDG
jgi:hypothetical protein